MFYLHDVVRNATKRALQNKVHAHAEAQPAPQKRNACYSYSEVQAIQSSQVIEKTTVPLPPLYFKCSCTLLLVVVLAIRPFQNILIVQTVKLKRISFTAKRVVRTVHTMSANDTTTDAYLTTKNHHKYMITPYHGTHTRVPHTHEKTHT